MDIIVLHWCFEISTVDKLHARRESTLISPSSCKDLDTPAPVDGKTHVFATSSGLAPRPRGMVEVNFCSSIECVDEELTHNPVFSETTGHTELNLILSEAYSTAIVLVAVITAALEALYHVSPGRGLMPAVDAMLTKDPPSALLFMYGTISASVTSVVGLQEIRQRCSSVVHHNIDLPILGINCGNDSFPVYLTSDVAQFESDSDFIRCSFTSFPSHIENDNLRTISNKILCDRFSKSSCSACDHRNLSFQCLRHIREVARKAAVQSYLSYSLLKSCLEYCDFGASNINTSHVFGNVHTSHGAPPPRPAAPHYYSASDDGAQLSGPVSSFSIRSSTRMIVHTLDQQQSSIHDARGDWKTTYALRQDIRVAHHTTIPRWRLSDLC
ncbi:hypothetical protein KC321_g76 [Hortaea werneckii]|nr:hypothetical protein KC321_g76 [Hortaea werneckii]